VSADRFRFRVWDKGANGWLKKSVYLDEYGALVGYAPHQDELTRLNDPNLIVMQCTGLKDKNGEPIYEGDICKIPACGTCSIRWASGEVWARPEMVGWVFVRLQYSSEVPLCPRRADRCVVIGNIYANPELLK